MSEGGAVVLDPCVSDALRGAAALLPLHPRGRGLVLRLLRRRVGCALRRPHLHGSFIRRRCARAPPVLPAPGRRLRPRGGGRALPFCARRGGVSGVSTESDTLQPAGCWSLLLVRALVLDGTLTRRRCRTLLQPFEQRLALHGEEPATAATEARGMVDAIVEVLFDDKLRARFLLDTLRRDGAGAAALAALEHLVDSGDVAEERVLEAMAQAVRDGAATPADGHAFWDLAGRPEVGDRLFQLLTVREGAVS